MLIHRRKFNIMIRTQIQRPDDLYREAKRIAAEQEISLAWRSNPRWAQIESAPVMGRVWAIARRPDLPRRALFDARIALTLRRHGVTEFATRNTSDFEDFGFAGLTNPIDASRGQVHDR
jgi:predicted nucleic acid-binding protein